MKKNPFLLIGCTLFFTATILCSNCAKEYSYEGGPQPQQPQQPPVVTTPDAAQYSLTGSPDYCVNFAVKGTYVAGENLSGQHTVDVSINVLKAGPFVLRTDTVNGIFFSKTGSFTTTGQQVVTLDGHGRPETTGFVSLHTIAPNSQCVIELAAQNPPPVATYVLEYGPGNPNPCTCNVQGTYQAQQPLSAANTITQTVFVTLEGNYTVETNKVNGIYFSKTGTFTSTGRQTITLKGYGTPVSVGNYVLYSQIVGPHPLGGAVCGITVPVQ